MNRNTRQVAEALKLVNKARGKLGRKPVTKLRKGDQEEPDSCAIAMSIGPGVCVMPHEAELRKIVVYEGHDGGPVLAKGGKYANDFALAFDQGLYPELIA